jgi:hypothetical protein
MNKGQTILAGLPGHVPNRAHFYNPKWHKKMFHVNFFSKKTSKVDMLYQAYMVSLLTENSGYYV